MKLFNKYIILAVAGGLSLASCSDFLDTDHPSEQDPTLTFSNTEDATLAINGVYVKFCEDPFTSRMSNVWMQNTDVETQTPSAGNPSGGHRSDLWGLQATADVSFGDIYKAWNNNYEAINLANKVIDGINASSIRSDAEMQQILGEAICLKSWRYLMLCNFWGDVPFYSVGALYGQQLDKPRTDKNIIYSSCLQQLVNIEPNMKWSDANTGGIERMNRDFCLGLIAKMALFRAGYGMSSDGTMKKADNYLDTNADSLSVTYTDLSGSSVTAHTSADYYKMAKNYCQKLLQLKDRSLGTDYSASFRNEVNRTVVNNADVLYEVAFLESKGGDVGWCIGVTNTNSLSNGNTTNQVGINPMYYMSFNENDARRDATCSRYSHNNDTIVPVKDALSMNITKWDRYNCSAALGASSSKGTGINWPLMRYSEVLLMLAEAENEINGPTSIAKNALKTVRARAFANSPRYTHDVTEYVDSVAESKGKFFNAVVDERAWELGGECVRKWDLARWNNYGEKINDNIYQQICYGIAMSPDLLAAEPSLATKYPDYVKYLNCADVLYYNKAVGTKSVSDLKWYNNKYGVLPDVAGKDSVNAASWGDALLKKVTTYIYNGTEYTGKPVKSTAADGTVTYTITEGSKKVVITAQKDAEGNINTGITRKVVYESTDYATRIFRGYTGDAGYGKGAVPYLMPIGTTTLSTSSVLSNDGYCFGYTGAGTNIVLGTVESPYK